MRRSLLASALLAIAACGDDGHDHDHDIDAPVVDGDAGTDAPVAPRETIMRTFQLQQGGISEPEFRLNAPTDRIRIRLQCDASTLAWNIHTHVGGDTQTLIEENAVSTVDHTLTGPANDYWLLLVNGTGTLTCDLILDLYGTAALTGGLPNGI